MSARDELEVMSDLISGSARQGACLSDRLVAIRALQDLWERGEVKKMLQHLQRLNDPVLSANIVQAGVLKGGRIDLESELGQGSTFRVHLPAGGDPTS